MAQPRRPRSAVEPPNDRPTPAASLACPLPPGYLPHTPISTADCVSPLLLCYFVAAVPPLLSLSFFLFLLSISFGVAVAGREGRTREQTTDIQTGTSRQADVP